MTHRLLLIVLVCFALISCNDDDDARFVDNGDRPDEVPGIEFVATENGDFEAIYRALTTALTTNVNITIVAEVDHRASAAIRGEELDPTRVVLFGNPRLGTPLMQINPQAGLDLPQRMLVYQNEQDDVILAYTTPEYLAGRHAVGVASTLGIISNALVQLAKTSTGGEVESYQNKEVSLNEGVISLTAPGTVGEVYAKLREAIAANANLSIVAELDHQANAKSVDLDLVPTKLIVFGNPALGTPLMKLRQSIGIDLPQKMLVYQSAVGEVTVCYNDPAYLAGRHGIDGATPELAIIKGALDGLAKNALGL